VEYSIKKKRNKVIIRAHKHGSWCSHVKGEILATITDTENGYIAHFPSFSSAQQDNYVCLDYSEADYLLHALGRFMLVEKQKGKTK
jgi:hypothetical protein